MEVIPFTRDSLRNVLEHYDRVNIEARFRAPTCPQTTRNYRVASRESLERALTVVSASKRGPYRRWGDLSIAQWNALVLMVTTFHILYQFPSYYS